MPETIVPDPELTDPDELLALIEQDPNAFTEGRRNDDLVNWFLATRIRDLKQDPLIDPMSRRLDDYIADFSRVRLTLEQSSHLQCWYNMTWARKIEQLYYHYGSEDQVYRLAYYWIPMSYRKLVVNTAPLF